MTVAAFFTRYPCFSSAFDVTFSVVSARDKRYQIQSVFLNDARSERRAMLSMLGLVGGNSIVYH